MSNYFLNQHEEELNDIQFNKIKGGNRKNSKCRGKKPKKAKERYFA